jgi:endoglucanase
MKRLFLAAILLATAAFSQTSIRSPSGTWTAVTPTADGTIVKAGSTATLTDAAGLVWGINAAGQVTMNGAPDLSTWGVAAIGIKGGTVEQANTAGAGYDKAVSQWTAAATPWVKVSAPPPTPSALSVKVSGNNIINGSGTPMQLRGVNVSGMEGTPFSSDPWHGSAPTFSAMKAWGINIVRLPLAEANWLGLCSTSLSQGVTPAVYQAAVQAAVTQATALGIYVILDLHIIAVPNSCPNGQNAMADAAHSPTFWTQVATAYKSNPAVLFELFNEPQGNYPPTTADWKNLVSGGLTGSQDTGMQAMLNAIRATGATNVVLVDTLNYASTFGNNVSSQTGYTDNPPGFTLPTDTVSPAQLVAVQHYYNAATKYETGANIVLNKGIPIMLTEYGESGAGTPDETAVYGWADPGGRASKALTSGGSSFPGVSYIAWTWDVGYGGYSLITNSAGGVASSAYAQAVHTHYLCRAAGTC